MTKKLEGTYTLVSHGIFKTDGTYVPTSDYHNGELYYGSDGTLHVLILFAKEPKVAKDIYGYVGRYKITSDKIVEHHFSVATSPRQVGAVEERTYEINGTDLKLGRVYPDGERFEALWTKR